MKTKEQLLQERQEIVTVWDYMCDHRDGRFRLPEVMYHLEKVTFGDDGSIKGECRDGNFIFEPAKRRLRTYTKRYGIDIEREYVDNRSNMEDYLISHPDADISEKDMYPAFSEFQLTMYMVGFFRGLRMHHVVVT